MGSPSDPIGHPSLETTVVAPVYGLEPDPAIDRYVGGFEAVGRDATELLDRLTDAQVNWRPSDGRWSIAECIAHLTESGRIYLPPLDRAIARGIERAVFGGRDFHPNWFGRLLIASMEPPPRRRMRAPKQIVPRHVESRARLAA